MQCEAQFRLEVVTAGLSWELDEWVASTARTRARNHRRVKLSSLSFEWHFVLRNILVRPVEKIVIVAVVARGMRSLPLTEDLW
jgi:hypothetical protein